jgi:hypothetical protein
VVFDGEDGLLKELELSCLEGVSSESRLLLLLEVAKKTVQVILKQDSTCSSAMREAVTMDAWNAR